jgi:uncharacterized protein (TIGR02996 family)
MMQRSAKMNDAAVLLAAIAAAPDSDELRLIYADWLEAQGDPRGEFIRLQCRLASDPAINQSDRQKLQAFASMLFTAYQREWNRPLQELGAFDVLYWRGLPEHVSIIGADFLAHAERLFALAPITSVRIAPKHVDAAALTASPHLAYVRSLNLAGAEIGDAGAQALASSPYASSLTTLDLERNGIGSAGAQAIAGSASLKQLRTLILGQNAIDDEAARAIADMPHLTTLDLGRNPLQPDTLAEISRIFAARRGLPIKSPEASQP